MPKKAKIELTPEEIMVYSLAEAGIPLKEIADKSDRSYRTIRRWADKVRKFLEKSDYDIEKYRRPIDGLYPLWLRSVMMNLKACDTTMTIAIGKGRQWLVEKKEHEDKSVSDMCATELDDYIMENYGELRKHESNPQEPRPGHC